MIKGLGAFLLGVLSVPVVIVFVELGEQGKNLSGWPGVFGLCIVTAAYFFICQLWLSRGNPHAFLNDWPIMLLLNAVLFLFLFTGFFVPENLNATYAVQSFPILLVCFAGTLAGAFVASRKAGKKAEQKLS
jgi:hypothetical protein